MSVSYQKKSDDQTALWKGPTYREKMMPHHKVKQDNIKDKGDCHFLHEKKKGFKGKPELSKLRDSSKSCGNSDFLKGYPVFE